MSLPHLKKTTTAKTKQNKQTNKKQKRDNSFTIMKLSFEKRKQFRSALKEKMKIFSLIIM